MSILRTLLLVILILAVAPTVAAAPPPQGCTPTVQQHGCTVFLAADDTLVLAGNNEDWRNPFTKMWFVPAEEGTFGQMYVGFDNFFPQGGMNDQGLFFDGLAVEPTIIPPDSDLPKPSSTLLNTALATCSTVQCVIDLFSQYDRSLMVGAQLFFGDANGDAVIIEPVEFIRKQDRFLVSTNFYQSITPLGEETCVRYKTAQAMLSDADTFSVDLFRAILDATHQDGNFPTQYSNIYDLKAQVMYLYYFQDFEHVVQIDLAEELAQGAHAVDIGTLFPENRTAAGWRQIRQRDFEVKLKRLGYTPDVDTSRFETYVGRYAVPQELIEMGALSAPYIEVGMEGEQLTYDIPGDFNPPVPLYPTSETTFLFTTYDDLLFDAEAVLLAAEVVIDGSGQVSAIKATTGDLTFEFARMP